VHSGAGNAVREFDRGVAGPHTCVERRGNLRQDCLHRIERIDCLGIPIPTQIAVVQRLQQGLGIVSDGVVRRPYAFGHMTLLLSGALFLAYLLAMVTSKYAPAPTRRREVWAAITVIQVAVVSTTAIWMSTRLVWTLIIDANPVIVEARIEDTVFVLGSLVSSLTAPLAFLGGLLHELPTRGGPPWLLRVKRATSWPPAVDDTPTASAEMPTTVRDAARRKERNKRNRDEIAALRSYFRRIDPVERQRRLAERKAHSKRARQARPKTMRPADLVPFYLLAQ
jgi:hypothetical protein